MFKKIFNHTTNGILAGASILALAALTSRALGFLRNALLASNFGAGEILDAYFLSFRLPDLFFNLLFFGALSAGFVPVFIKLRSSGSDGQKKSWQLANDIFNLSLLAFSVFGVIFFFAAPWIMSRIAPGFGAETLSLAVNMSRIMFLQPVLLGISGIFSGVLQSVKKFLSYSLAPIFYNLGIIFGILVLVPVLGPVGLAWGVVTGAFLHLVIQYPATRSSGWRWQPSLNIGFKALKRVLLVMVPRSASLIIGQVNLIVLVSLATLLGAGSVAVFNFANDLYSLPLGVVVIPLSVAAFPVFVSKLGEGKEALGDVFLQTLRRLLFLVTPLVVLALVLRAQVVRLTLGYGKFVWEDTVLTIETLGFLLLGLLFHAVLALVLRAFFALEDAKTPLVVLVLGMVVTIGGALLLRGFLGIGGLALGMALGMAFNATVLFAVLAKKIKLRKLGKLLRAFLSFLFGAIVAGVLARATLFLAVDYLVTTQKVWGLFVQATLATIVGGAVYIFISWLLKLPEVDSLWVRLGLSPPEGVTYEELPEEKLPR